MKDVKSDSSMVYYPNIWQACTLLMIFIIGFIIITSALMTALNDASLRPLIYLIGCLSSYSLTILISIWAEKQNGSQIKIFSFKNVPAKIFPLLLLSTIFLLAAIQPFINLIPIPRDIAKVLIPEANRTDIITFVTMVLLAPVFEELFFRGIILDGFLKLYKPVKAILISSIMFGIGHLNPWMLPAGFVLGLLTGWIYYKTRSLIPCIFIHFIANLSIFLMRFLVTFKLKSAVTLFDVNKIPYLIFILLFILTFYFLYRIDKSLKRNHKHTIKN